MLTADKHWTLKFDYYCIDWTWNNLADLPGEPRTIYTSVGKQTTNFYILPWLHKDNVHMITYDDNVLGVLSAIPTNVPQSQPWTYIGILVHDPNILYCSFSSFFFLIHWIKSCKCCSTCTSNISEVMSAYNWMIILLNLERIEHEHKTLPKYSKF